MSQNVGRDLPEHKENDLTDLGPLNIIRTETVLSRLPIHNLSKKGRVNIQITKKNKYGEIDLRWEVSYNDRYGQPRQLAYKLDTIVINQKTDELGRPLPKLIRLGSLMHICGLLGLVDGGRQKSDLKKAFHQNAGAYIIAKLHYRSVDGTERVLEAGFTRYSVIFTGERLPNGETADAVYLLLNDPYLDVLNHAPVRPLDYDYLKILTPTAQRFYEIISYRIFAALKYRHPHAKLLYSDYCTFSAQQRYYDYDHFKKQMYKVHRPHLQSGYLKNVSYEAMTDSEAQPDWMMLYVPGIKAQAEYKTFNSKHLTETPLLDENQEQGTVHELQEIEDHRITQAKALVAHFYKRFHSRENASPQPKEIDQAEKVIMEHGFERAKYLIDFSHRHALTTNYKPETFGGILHYTTRALEAYDVQVSHAQAQATIDTCTYCDRAGWIAFEDAQGQRFVSRCPHHLETIQHLELQKGYKRTR